MDTAYLRLITDLQPLAERTETMATSLVEALRQNPPTKEHIEAYWWTPLTILIHQFDQAIQTVKQWLELDKVETLPVPTLQLFEAALGRPVDLAAFQETSRAIEEGLRPLTEARARIAGHVTQISRHGLWRIQTLRGRTAFSDAPNPLAVQIANLGKLPSIQTPERMPIALPSSALDDHGFSTLTREIHAVVFGRAAEVATLYFQAERAPAIQLDPDEGVIRLNRAGVEPVHYSASGGAVWFSTARPDPIELTPIPAPQPLPDLGGTLLPKLQTWERRFGDWLDRDGTVEERQVWSSFLWPLLEKEATLRIERDCGEVPALDALMSVAGAMGFDPAAVAKRVEAFQSETEQVRDVLERLRLLWGRIAQTERPSRSVKAPDLLFGARAKDDAVMPRTVEPVADASFDDWVLVDGEPPVPDDPPLHILSATDEAAAPSRAGNLEASTLAASAQSQTVFRCPVDPIRGDIESKDVACACATADSPIPDDEGQKRFAVNIYMQYIVPRLTAWFRTEELNFGEGRSARSYRFDSERFSTKTEFMFHTPSSAEPLGFVEVSGWWNRKSDEVRVQFGRLQDAPPMDGAPTPQPEERDCGGKAEEES